MIKDGPQLHFESARSAYAHQRADGPIQAPASPAVLPPDEEAGTAEPTGSPPPPEPPDLGKH